MPTQSSPSDLRSNKPENPAMAPPEQFNEQIRLQDPAFVVKTDTRKMAACLSYVQGKPWNATKERVESLITNIYGEGFYNIDEKGLRAAIPSVVNGKPFFFARGIEPKDGKNGYVKHTFELNPVEKIWLSEEEGGNVDFRKSRDINNVKAGDLLATLLPPEPGEPGRDIFGGYIEALPGHETQIMVGKGVTLSEDGLKAYAELDGYVKRVHSRISVDRRKVVEGNVDFHTGHVDYNGDVLVMGDVKETFQVKALGSITISGSVDRSNVKAEGDITIQGGVYGKEGIEVTAEGDICIGFAENASIRAGGNIYVRNFLVNCNIQAGEKVYLKAMGKSVIGGRIRAAHGVIANSLGNPRIPTATTIEFGTTPEMVQMVRSLTLESQRANETRRFEIRDQLQEIREEYDRQLRARVAVRHTIYPGVKLIMEKAVYDVKTEITSMVFFKLREKNEIAMRAFGPRDDQAGK